MTDFDDVYFISSHVKAFNKDFRLRYDTLNNRYVVVNLADRSIVLSSEKYPDYSFIERLQRTKRENFFKLFDEIEKENEMLEEKKLSSACLKSKCQLGEILNFASKNPTKELNQNQIRKIIGENND